MCRGRRATKPSQAAISFRVHFFDSRICSKEVLSSAHSVIPTTVCSTLWYYERASSVSVALCSFACDLFPARVLRGQCSRTCLQIASRVFTVEKVRGRACTAPAIVSRMFLLYKLSKCCFTVSSLDSVYLHTLANMRSVV